MGYISRKIEIEPQEEHDIFFRKSCGVARFASNQGLAYWNYLYEEHKKDPSQPSPTWKLISRDFNEVKDQYYP